MFHHSQSMPDLDLHGEGSCKSSFDGSAKGGARLVAGDTRHAEMFVRDNLTSGFAPPASPLAGLLEGLHGSKPMSKYDPNTGKFYRSVLVDASSIPASLSALSLLSLFSGDELRYDVSTHTGTVINMAGQITVTCVGDTHVQTDAMYIKVQSILAALVNANEQIDQPAESEVDSVMGISLFNMGAKGQVEKNCELVADSCAGITLFAPADAFKREHKPVQMDTCCGMTMFSFVEEDDLSDQETQIDSSSEGRGSPSNLSFTGSFKQALMDTCAGISFFRSEKKQLPLEELVANTSGGITLYSHSQKQFPEDAHAETCGGITSFTPCKAQVEETLQSQCDEEVDEAGHVAFHSVLGFTDLCPALAKLKQDPESYTDEQKWLSELAWGVCA